MDPLKQAIIGLAHQAWVRIPQSFIQDLLDYLGEGDEAALRLALVIPEDRVSVLSQVFNAVPRPQKWGETERRFLSFLLKRSVVLSGETDKSHNGRSSDQLVGRFMRHVLQFEGKEDDFCGLFLERALELGILEKSWALLVARHVELMRPEQVLNSAGRYLLSRSPTEFVKLLPALKANSRDANLMEQFAKLDPQKIRAVLDLLVEQRLVDSMPGEGWSRLVAMDPQNFGKPAVAALGIMEAGRSRLRLARAIEVHFPGTHREAVLRVARDITQDPLEWEATAVWLVSMKDPDVVAALRDHVILAAAKYPYMESDLVNELRAVVKLIGADLKPALVAAMREDRPELMAGALELWINLRDPSDDPIIHTHLLAGLSLKDSKQVPKFVSIAAGWNLSEAAPKLWELVEHKSKPVREAATRVLAQGGEGQIMAAEKALASRKADTRLSGAVVLGGIGSEKSQSLLKEHMKREKAENVRDAIGRALEGGAKSGRDPASSLAGVGGGGKKEVLAAIAAAGSKLKPPPAWLKVNRLPTLPFLEGGTMSEDGIRYLVHRQAREKDMTLDAEAAKVVACLDRKRTGDFAMALIEAYQASDMDAQDRWVLALGGVLGDDRIVPVLSRQIDQWAESSRGKLAEYAVQALALLGSDAALLAVDAMAIRYRVKFKNIGKAASQAFQTAAQARGLSPAELGDRVVPWLGFEPGRDRIFEFGEQRVGVRIGMDFKLAWQDLAKNKLLKSLSASAPDAVKAEVKVLSAGLKEAAKAQLLRMENLMVQQNRWPVGRWRELFLRHPLLVPFGVRAVWGVYGEQGKLSGSFRALEDGTLTNVEDEGIELSVGDLVGILHPLDIDAGLCTRWVKHLADYDVTPPFPQLERPVVRVAAGQRKQVFSHDYDKHQMNGMTFKGRAERLGWTRGSVVDAGGISHYWKSFPAAGVDVFLSLEGMYVGIDMYSDITLGVCFFVEHGSVKVGGYEYNEPESAKDPRLIPFENVTEIAFSEAMGDLARIAAKSQRTSDE